MILDGNITIPYKWTTGPAVGRFLGELRDNARIMGARCETCDKVYAPPPDVCGECYRPLDRWVELSGEGRVVAISVVARRMPWSPVEPPYNLALIKLDGADTSILHLVGDEINSGDRVRALFNSDRAGSLLDILRFEKQEYRDASIVEKSQVSASEAAVIERTSFDISSLTETRQVFHALPVLFKKFKTDKQLTYYFSIDGEQWTVEVGPETCVVRPGKVENADCFLKTTREIFLGTIKGDYTPSLTDIMSGRVKTNNPILLQTFKNIFVD
jgi:hypothetical protein